MTAYPNRPRRPPMNTHFEIGHCIFVQPYRWKCIPGTDSLCFPLRKKDFHNKFEQTSYSSHRLQADRPAEKPPDIPVPSHP